MQFIIVFEKDVSYIWSLPSAPMAYEFKIYPSPPLLPSDLEFVPLYKLFPIWYVFCIVNNVEFVPNIPPQLLADKLPDL